MTPHQPKLWFQFLVARPHLPVGDFLSNSADKRPYQVTATLTSLMHTHILCWLCNL